MVEPRTMGEPRTQTLDVPGARLSYDIRDAEGEPTAPALLMIASPMAATASPPWPGISVTGRW